MHVLSLSMRLALCPTLCARESLAGERAPDEIAAVHAFSLEQLSLDYRIIKSRS